MKHHRTQQGFIIAPVVLAVVGLAAAIAIPQYVAYQERAAAHRAEQLQNSQPTELRIEQNALPAAQE